MSDLTARTRPTGVTIVAGLVFLAALVNLARGVWMIFAPLGDNPTVAAIPGLENSPQVEIPGWYLVMNGILALVLGLIYLWLGRNTLAGRADAQILINVLAVINIIFALFRLDNWTGWIALAVNILILIFANSSAANAWFKPQRML